MVLSNYLSRSIARVKFLALAATLVSLTDTFRAGTALEKMILASAFDQELLTIVYHLNEVVNSLIQRPLQHK